MRVIAGRAKGRRLLGPKAGSQTRPITDRAKEAVFSILDPRLPGCRFLDLFSGTGAVGIEALSRGARQATFVEVDSGMIRTLRRNLQRTELERGGEVLRTSVLDFLEREPRPFDLIYVAPPQYKDLWIDTLHALDRTPGWLSPDGVVVVQIHPVEFRALSLSDLSLSNQRSYGSVDLCFYSRPPSPGPASTA